MKRKDLGKKTYEKPEVISEKVVFAGGPPSPVACSKWGGSSNPFGGNDDCTGPGTPARS